jgi:hypothetical protein
VVQRNRAAVAADARHAARNRVLARVESMFMPKSAVLCEFAPASVALRAGPVVIGQPAVRSRRENNGSIL